MNPDAVQKYIKVMVEIKRRSLVVDSFSKGTSHAMFKATSIETIYLQFRKIIELIAMSTLVANKETYSVIYEKFASSWNAKYIIKDIERLNPRFYPTPIIQQSSNRRGVISDFIKRKEVDYLTKDELLTLYDKCGPILHTENPYGSQINYSYYDENVLKWRNKIRNLLNAHEIRLLNDENLYLIQMGANEELPTYTAFAPIEKPK